MPEKRILIVHPYDRSTSFLDRVKNHLQYQFDNDVHYFSVKPNDESHNQCLDRISAHPENGLIIFLGHGRSDKLYGSKADDYTAMVSSEAMAESPDRYYYNDDFINEGNIEVFKGKKIFCLACNSREKIASYAYEKGAKSFLGFGDIPTSDREFLEKGTSVGEDVVSTMKAELNYIVKTAISFSIQRNSTFEGLLQAIQFITNQKMIDVLTNRKNFKERHLLTDYLYYFKKDARIIGSRGINLLS